MILPGKFTPANFLLSIIRFVRIISIRPHDQFGTRKLWLHELALHFGHFGSFILPI